MGIKLTGSDCHHVTYCDIFPFCRAVVGVACIRPNRPPVSQPWCSTMVYSHSLLHNSKSAIRLLFLFNSTFLRILHRNEQSSFIWFFDGSKEHHLQLSFLQDNPNYLSWTTHMEHPGIETYGQLPASWMLQLANDHKTGLFKTRHFRFYERMKKIIGINFAPPLRMGLKTTNNWNRYQQGLPFKYRFRRICQLGGINSLIVDGISSSSMATQLFILDASE